MDMLKTVSIDGYKTIRELKNLDFKPLTVFIGANGAGKSNFISFFRVLSWMCGGGNLQCFVAEEGGASVVLHDGPKVTPHTEGSLCLETHAGSNEYSFRLAHAAGDTLIFLEEKYRFSSSERDTISSWTEVDPGKKESQLKERADAGDQTAKVILGLLRRCIVHQFHDTSRKSRIRQKWDVSDNQYLKEDAANLAPFLFRLKEGQIEYYGRITETIRLVLPFFLDFQFNPDHNKLLLQWSEVGTDVVFGAHQASDGMLRVMALISLLLQPENNFPMVLILDEPELGLHPAAIDVVAGLIKSATLHTQIILATQSTAFVDQFDPEDIVVVQREGRESTFRRLNENELTNWLSEYSLSELWEKNVFGGIIS